MAANLIEALVEWIDAQPGVTDMFPRGIYNEMGPLGSIAPALILSQDTGRVLGLAGVGWGVHWYEVKVEVQSEYAEDTRRLADTVRDMILAGAPFSWTGGREIDRYETNGAGGRMEKVVGGEGALVWVHTIPLIFVAVRD